MSDQSQAAPAAPATIEIAQALAAVADAAQSGVQSTPETSAITEDSAALEAAAPEVPAAPEPPKQDDKFAAKFAALSKKEKQVRQREQAVDRRMAEMEAKFKAQEETLKPFMSLKDNASKDPGVLFENLKAAGLTEQQIIERYILKQEPTPEEKQTNILQQLQKEIEALKSERSRDIEMAKQNEAKSKEQGQQQAKDNYIKYLGEFVAKNADQYELIRNNDSVDLIYDVIEEHYNLTEQENGAGQGVILTERDAADRVEEFLLEQAKKLIETNKLKQLVGTRTPTPAPIKGQSATLSNSLAQKVPSKAEPYLSDAESKKRFAAAIKFTS